MGVLREQFSCKVNSIYTDKVQFADQTDKTMILKMQFPLFCVGLGVHVLRAVCVLSKANN